MAFALTARYGDRISQIGLFSFKVRATGEIYESGVAISDMLTYINKWPHINWLLTVANDGANSIFRALRDNTDGAQDRFLSEIVRIMEKYPWCDGIDIDLERGDGYRTTSNGVPGNGLKKASPTADFKFMATAGRTTIWSSTRRRQRSSGSSMTIT